MATYNPDHLDSAKFARVSDICQTVMGLNPKESLRGGYWPGEPRLDYDTSEYRVCIISLSDSLQSVAEAQLAQQADADCRRKGFSPSSLELALCVLQTVNEPRLAQSTSAQRLVTLASVSELPHAPTSYYRASPHDYVRRERLACAALGLNPSQDIFGRCVKNVNHALHSLDEPII